MQAYLDFQINMAELLGADRNRVVRELEENLKFETTIANVSLQFLNIKLSLILLLQF